MGQSTAKILAHNRLFQGLSERIIDRLAAITSKRVYGKDERIFAQGDPGDSLLCVVSGRVRISAVGAGGQEVFLNIMEPGDSFGEIGVVDGNPRTAGATAMEATTVLSIRRADFLSLLREESDLTLHLLELFCERIRWTSNLYEESAFLNAPSRLAKRVLNLAMLHGRQMDDGYELRISQSDLAQFLGMSRQIVNHHLQSWRSAGYVDVARARLKVLDPSSLRRIAGSAGDRAD